MVFLNPIVQKAIDWDAPPHQLLGSQTFLLATRREDGSGFRTNVLLWVGNLEHSKTALLATRGRDRVRDGWHPTGL